MAEIINLFGKKKRIRIEEIESNSIYCVDCDVCFEAEIVPGMSSGYRCPHCNTNKTYVSHFQFRDETTWQCKCGSFVFAITESGFRCLCCGVHVDYGAD